MADVLALPAEAAPPDEIRCRHCNLPIYPSWRAEAWLHRYGSPECAEAREDEAEFGGTASHSKRLGED